MNMLTKHNKKRNVGLMYEFLTREVADAVITGDSEKSEKVLKLIENSFAQGSELLRELKIFNALIVHKTSSDNIAARIIDEAHAAVSRIDEKKLNSEKTKLINASEALDIGHMYEHKIPDYRKLAAIQSLFNAWRSNKLNETNNVNESLNDIIEAEQILFEHLRSADIKTKNDYLEKKNNKQSDQLVEKMMIEKLNERYAGSLTEGQVKLLKSYALYGEHNQQLLSETLATVRANALDALNEIINGDIGAESSSVCAKASDARDMIYELNKQSLIDDASISKHMTLAGLIDEMRE